MPSPLKSAVLLSLEERQKAGGCTHLQPLTFADLTDTAATTKTLTILEGTARQGIGRIFIVNKTPFDGGATTNLSVKAILNYASGTDKDLTDAIEIHVDATELLAAPAEIAVVDSSTTDTTFGAQELAVLDSLRTKVNQVLGRLPIMPNVAWSLDLLFTATGANLTALDTGKLQVFAELIDLSDFNQVV